MSETNAQTKAEVVRESEIGTKREILEFSVVLPETDVSKILSASASVTIDKFEALLGELSFSGEACLNLVYALEDGTISSHKTCQDFNGKFESLAIDPSTLVKILPNILEIQVENGTGNSIKVKVLLENTFFAMKNQEINVFENTDDNVFVKESEMTLSKHKSRNCSTFSQTSIFETKVPVKNILNITSGAIIGKVDVLDEIVVFEGEVITKVLYSSNEDNSRLICLSNKDIFREEIEDANAERENLVWAGATVLQKEIEETIDSENKTIEIAIPIKICYDLFENKTIKTTADAFSTTNELNLTTEAFITTEVVGNETFDNKIDGTISLNEQALRVDKILAVDGAYLTTISENFENGELKSEGLVHLNLIYLNDDEESTNAVSLEIPYSFKEKISAESPARVQTKSQIVEIDASVKRGKDIYIDGKIKTEVWILKDKENAIITEAQIGEAFEERDGAVEIYFAQEGKTMWDVAKDMKVSEEILKQQNPEVVEPFGQSEKIVFFNQIQLDDK